MPYLLFGAECILGCSDYLEDITCRLRELAGPECCPPGYVPENGEHFRRHGTGRYLYSIWHFAAEHSAYYVYLEEDRAAVAPVDDLQRMFGTVCRAQSKTLLDAYSARNAGDSAAFPELREVPTPLLLLAGTAPGLVTDNSWRHPWHWRYGGTHSCEIAPAKYYGVLRMVQVRGERPPAIKFLWVTGYYNLYRTSNAIALICHACRNSDIAPRGPYWSNSPVGVAEAVESAERSECDTHTVRNDVAYLEATIQARLEMLEAYRNPPNPKKFFEQAGYTIDEVNDVLDGAYANDVDWLRKVVFRC